MKIREADLSDIEAIKKCVDACSSPLYFTDDTTIEWLQDNLKDNGICYIAEEQDEVVGYCILIYEDRVWHTAKDIGYARINQMETMGVQAAWQNMGIAKKLVEECKQHIRTKVTLATVHPENVASKKVLQKCGFQYYKNTILYDQSPREIWLYLLNIEIMLDRIAEFKAKRANIHAGFDAKH